MLVHSVFFWLRSDLSDEERAAFQVGVDTLTTIQSASATYIGTPAATKERPPVDSSYDVGLVVMLDDVAAHDAYQVDPIHLEFIERFSTFWRKVQIYDAD